MQSTWRTLTGEARAYADMLLDAAALWIRDRAPAVADGSPAARIVSIEVVRAALQRDVFGGTSAGTATRGGRTDSWITSRTATLAELAETLVFSDYHRTLLGIRKPTGARFDFGSRSRGPDPIRFRPQGWD